MPSLVKKQVLLHRCRFPDWSPSSTMSLSLTPMSFDAGLLNLGGSSADRGVLAVGKANGDVDLMVWGGEQSWVLYRTLPSPFPPVSSKKPIPLLTHVVFAHQTHVSHDDAELFADDPKKLKAYTEKLKRTGVRLFGVGGIRNELIEFEWGCPGSASKQVGMIKSTLSNLPPILSIAVNASSTRLALGCDDSTIRIVNIEDGALEPVSKADVGGAGRVKALSLVWHNGDSQLIAGCSNSCIRKYDVISNIPKSVQKMTLDRLKGDNTLVWSLASVNSTTLMSGDSMGNVKFWDIKTGTQLQSFKAHRSDVLALCAGNTGTNAFSAGVDQKTCEYKLTQVKNAKTGVENLTRWVLSSGRRLHSHDVRALAMSPPSPQDGVVPVLTSAGIDLSLVLVSAAPAELALANKHLKLNLKNPITDSLYIEFDNSSHRKASYVPQRNSPFDAAKNTRYFLCRRERSLALFKINQPKRLRSHSEQESEVDGQENDATPWEKVLEMQLKTQTNLISSAISPNGKWIAVSDLYETKLLQVRVNYEGEVSVKRFKTFSSILSDALPTTLGTGAIQITFTHDSRKLILGTAFGSYIVVVDLKDVVVECVLDGHSKTPQKRLIKKRKGAESNGDVVMDDGESLNEEDRVPSDDSDVTSSLCVFAVSEDNTYLCSADTSRRVIIHDLSRNKLQSYLPTLQSVPSAITFVPKTEQYPTDLILIGFPDNSILPYDMTKKQFLVSRYESPLLSLREPLINISFETTSEHTRHIAIVWGANWLVKIDLKELTTQPKTSKKEGKRDKASTKIIHRYQPLVLFDFFAQTETSSEAVVIEATWLDVSKYLPEAFARIGEYGA